MVLGTRGPPLGEKKKGKEKQKTYNKKIKCGKNKGGPPPTVSFLHKNKNSSAPLEKG